METSVPILLPSIFKFCQVTPPPSLPTSTSTALFVVLFLWLNRLSCHIWFIFYFSTHVEPGDLCTRRTLLSIFCNKVSSLLRSDTWWGFLLILWFIITHTQTHTHNDKAHSDANRLTHSYINIYYVVTTAICITLNE